MSEEEEDYGDSGSDWRSSAGGSETSYDEDFGLGEPSVEEVVGSSGRTPYTVRTPTACARPHVLTLRGEGRVPPPPFGWDVTNPRWGACVPARPRQRTRWQ